MSKIDELNEELHSLECGLESALDFNDDARANQILDKIYKVNKKLNKLTNPHSSMQSAKGKLTQYEEILIQFISESGNKDNFNQWMDNNYPSDLNKCI